MSFGGHVAEAAGIAELAAHLVQSEGVPPSEILVLIRADHNQMFSKLITDQLAVRDIPCTDPERVNRMLGEPDNRRLLEVLRLLVNRYDSISWAGLLHVTSGIPGSFLEDVYETALGRNERFGTVLLASYEADLFPGASKRASNAARMLIDRTLAWLDAHPLPELGEDFAWGNWIMETAGDESAPAPTADLQELLTAVDGLVEPARPGAEPAQALGRYLGQLTPVGDDWARAESAGVRIMTMSGAKGLTVRATILGALEDMIIPRRDGDLHEERRLLYVGMTRARQYAYGTWARRRTGQTARSGGGQTMRRRVLTSFLRGGPIESQDGDEFICQRWG